MRSVPQWVSLCLWLGSGPILPAQETATMAELKRMSMEDLLAVTAVSASRHRQKHIDSPRSMSVITADELRKRNYRTVPEALNELVGVMVQETNYGGGSPIIRGMVGNRILILVDGIRLNNSTYRLGPNQYLNTIDIHQVDRIEVIRGPGSVLYGSDALGGLVNIITRGREGAEAGTEIHPRVFSRISSADRGASSRLELGGHHRRLGFLGGVSARRFGDLRAGRGTGRQPFTGYDEIDGDLKLSYRLSARQSAVLGWQRVHQDTVRRSHLLVAGSDLKYEWSPQQRDLAYGQYRIEGVGSFVDSLQAEFSFHRPVEKLYRTSAARPEVESQYEDEVHSRGFALQLSSLAGERQLLTYGLEYQSDLVRSRRVDLDLRSGSRMEGRGTLADGARYGSLAAFVQDELQVFGPLALNLGLRYTRISLQAVTNDPRTGAIPIETSLHDFTESAYASWRLSPTVHAIAGVAEGFRAPNVNDATILSDSGGRFEIPSWRLRPEKNLTYEAGLKTQWKKFSGTAAYFVTRYRGLIDRAPATFKGLPFLDINQNGIKDLGEPGIFQRQNIGRARVRGIGVEGQVRFERPWALFGNASWTRGEDTITSDPLTRIPPLKGILGGRWTPARSVWLEAYSLFAGRQDRLSPEDRRDPRIRPEGTAGFVTVNLRGGLDLPRLGTLTIGLENLTNKAYRWHGSGIDAPGRNLVIGIERSF